MSGYSLSIIQRLKAIACHRALAGRACSGVKENLVEIPVLIVPNHAPATNYNYMIRKEFIRLDQSGPIEACPDTAIPTENLSVASDHGAY